MKVDKDVKVAKPDDKEQAAGVKRPSQPLLDAKTAADFNKRKKT